MKKILTLVCVSALGGLLTLGGYKLFVEKEQKQIVDSSNTSQLPVYVPTSTTNTLLKNAEHPDLITAANKTIDAVVHVKNTQINRGPQTWGDIFSGQTKERKQLAGAGSGVIISPDGHIITNNHVIKGAAEISVTLNDNKTYMADLVGTDSKNDIALLKIDADEQLPFVAFGDSDATQIGEWVLAVGNPFNLTSTVTAGIISAKSRDLSGGQSFIQTDAAVNPGNSGGALVNTRGELVGINTAISSKTGSFVGYSFAVPSNIAKKIVDDLLEFGTVQEAILGINIDRRDNNIDGVRISELPEDSEAKKAGLKSGDIIKKVNNVKISKFSELRGQLTAKRPGELVDITVDRDGEFITKSVKLSKKDTYFSSNLNIMLKDLNKKELKKYLIIQVDDEITK